MIILICLISLIKEIVFQTYSILIFSPLCKTERVFLKFLPSDIHFPCNSLAYFFLFKTILCHILVLWNSPKINISSHSFTYKGFDFQYKLSCLFTKLLRYQPFFQQLLNVFNYTHKIVKLCSNLPFYFTKEMTLLVLSFYSQHKAHSQA